jgi:hypothetical protein
MVLIQAMFFASCLEIATTRSQKNIPMRSPAT